MSPVAPTPKRGRARPTHAAAGEHGHASAPVEAKPLSVFLPAAPADAPLRDRLRSHLLPLEKSGLLDTATEAGLADADIVLAVVSIDFLNESGSFGAAMDAALERNRQRIGRVIPVIARPCLWDATPFAGLQALPHHARAISSSPSEEETLVDVVRSVRAIAEQMRTRPPAAG